MSPRTGPSSTARRRWPRRGWGTRSAPAGGRERAAVRHAEPGQPQRDRRPRPARAPGREPRPADGRGRAGGAAAALDVAGPRGGPPWSPGDGDFDRRVQADALVTADRGRAVSVRTADCCPVLLATADGRAVAAAHAGWRGAVAGVVGAAVAELCRVAGTTGPAGLIAAVGPCIGVDAFEVGPEVLAAFADRFGADTVRRDGPAARGTPTCPPRSVRRSLAAAGRAGRPDRHDRPVQRPRRRRVLQPPPRPRRHRPHGRRDRGPMTSAAPLPPARRRDRLLPPLLVAVVTAAVFARLAACSFTYWDDQDTIWGNPRLNPPSLSSALFYWTAIGKGTPGELYTPVTYTAWSAQAAVAGRPPDADGIRLSPAVFHAANVLVHAAAAAAVCRLLLQLFGRPWPAVGRRAAVRPAPGPGRGRRLVFGHEGRALRHVRRRRPVGVRVVRAGPAGGAGGGGGTRWPRPCSHWPCCPSRPRWSCRRWRS